MAQRAQSGSKEQTRVELDGLNPHSVFGLCAAFALCAPLRSSAATPLPLTSPPVPALTFQIHATDGRARCGTVTTRNGSFQTPAFMPVGTQGTVKGLTPRMLAEAGAECILGNTYHLMLRPGEQTVARLGDLHKFMAWPGSILTDSGGFQVFSLVHVSRMDEDGVTFRSHLDGSLVRLTPERSMQVQNDLGADIIMAFDHCPPGDAPVDLQRAAMERTLRWAERCVKAHARADAQSLFGIVQGGTDLGLRARCAAELAGLDLPGYALGGLAVGEGFEAMRAVLAHAAPLLPSEKPRYLMGVGYPRDIVEAVASGVDMFDCVLPTRNGRGRGDAAAEERPVCRGRRADRAGVRLLRLPDVFAGGRPALLFGRRDAWPDVGEPA